MKGCSTIFKLYYTQFFKYFMNSFQDAYRQISILFDEN